MTSSGYGGVDLNLISTTQIDIFFAGCISPHCFVPPYLRNGVCITDTKKKKKKGGKQTRSPVQEQPAGTLMSVASCNITRNSTDPQVKEPDRLVFNCPQDSYWPKNSHTQRMYQ